MADTRLQVVISAKDEASATFNKLGGSIRDLNSRFEDTARVFKIGGAILTGAGIAALSLAKQFIWTAGRTEELGLAMNAVARATGTSIQMLAEQEKIMKEQGITTQEARVALTRFMQANIDVAQAAKIARVAQDLAVLSAMDSSVATGILVDSISSLNTIQLSQFGLTKNQISIFEDYGKELGILTEKTLKTGAVQNIWSRELTETEKKQALLNYIIEEGSRVTGIYETAMTKFLKSWRSLRRYVEESANALGEALLPYMAKFVQVITNVFKWFLKLNPEVHRFIGIAIVVGGTVMTLMGSFLIFLGFLPQVWTGIQLLGSAFVGLFSPIGLLVSLIGISLLGALALFGAYAYTHTEQIKQWFGEAYQKIVEWYQRMKEAWQDPVVKQAMDDLKGAVEHLFNAIGTLFNTLSGAGTAKDNLNTMTPEERHRKDVENMAIVVEFFANALNALAKAIEWASTQWDKYWPKLRDGWQGLKDIWNNKQIQAFAESSKATGLISNVIPWDKKQAGGFVSRTAPYLLHQGERVLPAGTFTGRGGQGNTIIINISGGIINKEGWSIDELQKQLGKAVQLARMGV